jgi:hypothetical protein
MNYIGNFAEWIDSSWVNEVSANRGTARPSEGKRPDSLEEELEYAKARAAGYKDDDTFFYMFTKNNTSFDIVAPFINGKYHWWITKMLPGNFMPVHVDPHAIFQKNSKRYWMPWQDYEPGHLFLYEEQVITNYKKGDLYEYANSSAIHGASNIGHSPRIVLQISTFED